jgi:hypothetical protein
MSDMRNPYGPNGTGPREAGRGSGATREGKRLSADEAQALLDQLPQDEVRSNPEGIVRGVVDPMSHPAHYNGGYCHCPLCDPWA